MTYCYDNVSFVGSFIDFCLSSIYNKCMDSTYFTPIIIGNAKINFLDLYGLFQQNEISKTSHFHNTFEIHFVLSGEAKMNVGSNSYLFTKSKMYIIPPNLPHSLDSKSNDYETLTIAFYIEPVNNSTINKYEHKYFCDVFNFTELKAIKTNKNYNEIVATLLSNSNVFTTYSINKINVKISELILEIANKLSNSTPSSNSPTIPANEFATRKYKVVTYIQQSIINKQKPSLTELADMLFISTRHLERFIQKEFNLTFKQLCLNHQMVAAKKLIIKSELSLNQVAINLGFDSYKGFALAFKKYYGFAPTKLRS